MVNNYGKTLIDDAHVTYAILTFASVWIIRIPQRIVPYQITCTIVSHHSCTQSKRIQIHKFRCYRFMTLAWSEYSKYWLGEF